MKREMLLEGLPAGKLPPWLLRKVLPGSSTDPRVIVGPGVGRDAAAIAVGDRVIVAKSDPITFVSDGGERHLVDVNANDIACMGATPRWLLVTSLLPVGTTPADVLNGFAALREACRQRAIELVGGHSEVVAGLGHPILVGMMLGESTPDQLIEPGMARSGDVLLLTKALAIEGTALLANEQRDELTVRVGESVVASASDLLNRPGISVIKEAEIAREAGGVTALHDPTEGGIATAVREVAMVSGTGAALDLDALPILPETREIAAALSLDPLGMLASGSLLIAARPGAAQSLVRDITAAGIPATPIGVLTDDPGELLMGSGGTQRPLPDFAVDEVARYLSGKKEIQARSTPC